MRVQVSNACTRMRFALTHVRMHVMLRAHEQFIVVYIHAVTINTRMTSIVIASVVASVYLHQSKSSLIFVLLYSIMGL